MTARITPRRLTDLREIPCVSPPPKRNLRLVLSLLAGTVVALVAYQAALLSGQITLAGYDYASQTRDGFLGTVLGRVSLNPPVYLTRGEELVGH